MTITKIYSGIIGVAVASAAVLMPQSSGGRDSTESRLIDTTRVHNPVALQAPLLDAIRRRFQSVDPSIRVVELLDLRFFAQDSVWYAIIAHGVGPHRGWKSPAEVGELFGVFGVDSLLTTVTRTFDIFPTQRLGDYDVWFDRSWVRDSFVVSGHGATYGDVPIRRVYPRGDP